MGNCAFLNLKASVNSDATEEQRAVLAWFANGMDEKNYPLFPNHPFFEQQLASENPFWGFGNAARYADDKMWVMAHNSQCFTFDAQTNQLEIRRGTKESYVYEVFVDWIKSFCTGFAYILSDSMAHEMWPIVIWGTEEECRADAPTPYFANENHWMQP